MTGFLGTVDLARIGPGLFRDAPRAVPANEAGQSHLVLGAGAIDLTFDPDHAIWGTQGDLAALIAGEARFGTAAPKPDAASNAVAHWLASYQRKGVEALLDVRGRFALMLFDASKRTVTLAVDRFGIQPLCYGIQGARVAFSGRADEVPGTAANAMDLQSLYRYFYFHVVPAPETIFQGVSRVDAGYFATIGAQSPEPQVRRYWMPRFNETTAADFNTLKEEFRTLLRDAVKRESEGDVVGAFLSGGTDSSTVSGLLTEISGKPAQTYSIGFEAEGYDEMEYARLAARHFGTQHHEYYVTPADLLESIPKVAKHFDQPFGNSSAAPSFHCARSAHQDGITKLLAGDGGDELFGGNSRYAKQSVFETYFRVPGPLRSMLIEPALLGWSAPEKIPLVRKARSYVKQAIIPLPDRMNTYNLLERLVPKTVLSPRFLEAVDATEPARQQARVYADSTAGTALNRMLAYDWKYTLADCDLPKVCGATGLADTRVGFPFLDEDLVDFSLRLAPDFKLKGLQLRWFFKEALRDFLPEGIIKKKKHGFGLPFGVWTSRDPALKRLATESVHALAARGIIREPFARSLIEEYLPQHPGYYGEMIWIMTILEQWLQRRMPAYRL